MTPEEFLARILVIERQLIDVVTEIELLKSDLADNAELTATDETC